MFQLFFYSNIKQLCQIDNAPGEKPVNGVRFRFVLLFVSLTLLFSELAGQNISPGHPLLRNYTPEEMGGLDQNWKIVQDYRNVMYFANQKGVIEYDGTYWNKIDINGEKPARAMAMDKNGTIYVGSVGEFGRLLPDEKGQLQYKSLIHLLPEELKGFTGRIFQIICYNNLVYFNTYYERITYDTGQNLIEVLIYPDRFFKGHIVDDNYYVSSEFRGLVKIENDSLVDMPNASFFKNNRIEKMLKISDDICFVFTRFSGVYDYNTKTGEVTQIDLDPVLLNDITTNTLYEVVRLPSGDIELSTLYGGSYILTSELRVKQFYNQKSGIQNETILSCLTANDESIWYGLNSGITHVKTDIPVWNLSKQHNLEGIIWDFVLSDNKLLVATSSGLFLCNLLSLQPTFIEILNEEDNSFGQTTTIQVIDENDNEQVFLAGTMTGIKFIQLQEASERGYAVSRKEKGYCGKILLSRYNSQHIYIGFDGGVLCYSMVGNKFEKLDKFLIPNLITRLVETEDHFIWTGLVNGTLVKMNFFNHTKTEYTIRDFTQDPDIGFYDIYFWDNVLYIFTTAGIYQYSKEEDKFVTAGLFNEIEFLQNKKMINCANDSVGNFFISCYEIEDGFKKYYHGVVSNSGPYKNEFICFAELPSIIRDNEFFANNGIVWFGFNMDIYAINVNRYLKYQEKRSAGSIYSCLIRNITAMDTVVIYGGYNSENLEDLSIPFEHRDLKIKWSAPYFHQEEKTLYKYSLRGRKKLQNMQWDRILEMQLMNLPAGKYSFTVEALNVRNEISQPAIFSFKILFPWYMKWYMFILYSIVFIYLIRLTYRLYNKKLIRDNIRLESIVSERTTKIRQQNEIIEFKNLQITSSINYAKHIQDSLLLTAEEYRDMYEKLFVYFRPRDVVSGDFYWFYRVGDLLFAAAVDCTGHGVPGAFMSMIGNTLLNDIIIDKKVTEPAIILSTLNQMIKETLHQKTDTRRAQDGMDMSLIILDLNSGLLKYAGAKNSIFIVKDKKIEELKASPWSIGGLSPGSRLSNKVKFTQQELILNKSTDVYLFSDGYMDQFQSGSEVKFSKKRFIELLRSCSRMIQEQQYEIFSQTMNEWIGQSAQMDDMLIIGVRF